MGRSPLAESKLWREPLSLGLQTSFQENEPLCVRTGRDLRDKLVPTALLQKGTLPPEKITRPGIPT